jgi:hypothetical protein|tara:strand:+ start:1562 stop:2020 length:459 start_codon:yes stop_codon:yes gene_type:complete
MRKHRLKLYDFDQKYILLAIHSNAEIFKIAYSLNALLKISLKRESDIDFKDRGIGYCLYKYNSTKYESKMFLFSNKSINSSKILTGSTLFSKLDRASLFIPDYPKVEYFLKIEDGKFNIKDLTEKIISSKNIISCYEAPLKTEKSKYNLIFE